LNRIFRPIPGPSFREIPAMPYRDRDAYRALVDLLSASGEFAAVSFGLPADPRPADLLRQPSAQVVPEGWAEEPDTTPGATLRTARYSLILTVSHPGPWDRFLAADRLSAIVQNLVIGSDLAGTCLAPLTRLDQGRFPATPGTHPDLRVVLDGRFTYRIPAPASREATL
jgi:hypothetical protein